MVQAGGGEDNEQGEKNHEESSDHDVDEMTHPLVVLLLLRCRLRHANRLQVKDGEHVGEDHVRQVV